MGSHIDAFFPHAIVRSPDELRTRLDAAMSELAVELTMIRERGRFSTGSGGWLLWFDEAAVTGHGPSGLSISVHSAVAELTSGERFGSVERPDQGIHSALRRVFEGVAVAFGAGGRLAVASGGFGDTDLAADLALAGAGFAEVCGCLEAVVGPPARSWAELEEGERGWYLSTQDAEQITAPDGDEHS